MRTPYPNELYHYGIRGQKWGVRRFQNPDGTLTSAGKQRYGFKEEDNPVGLKVKKGSLLERRFAREEAMYTKYSNKTKEKIKNAEDEGDVVKKERLEKKQKAYEAGIKKYQDMAEKYYSKDEESRRKIDRGYAAIQVLPILFSPIGGAIGGALVGGGSYYAAGKYAEKKLKD